jgi:hypothetical protein
MKGLSPLAILGLAALAAACTPTAVDPTPKPLGPSPVDALGPALNAAQIQQALVGNTGLGSRTGTMASWGMYVSPDGRLAGRGASSTDSGQWRITPDNLFCMRWRVDWDGQEICQTVHRVNDTTVKLASRDTVEVLSLVRGER